MPEKRSAARTYVYLLTIITVLVFATIGFWLMFPGIIKAAYNFIAQPSNSLASVNGRTNILVMGKAGGASSGPDLTDTMMVVSVKSSKITIVSIPRDLWIPEMRAKINSAYYWGKTGSSYVDPEKNGGGIGFAKIIVAEVVGEPIQYGIVIDFSSFKDIIDAIGGINVNVVTSFSDNFYPIAGRENDTCDGDPKLACRYMTITFNDGPQKMDGERALMFVRSRQAEGIEGTDLAREARQQKVIDAIKTKISDPKVFLSPKVVFALVNIGKKYIETDMDLPSATSLLRKLITARDNTQQYLMPKGMLINPRVSKTYDNLYVFIPERGSGDWQEINKWFGNILGQP